MDDVTARFERVEARLAIAELSSRYAVAVDTRKLDDIVALYIEEVAVSEG